MVNVSIVIYKSSWKEIEKLISVLNLEKIVNKIFIIDNSPTHITISGTFG